MFSYAGTYDRKSFDGENFAFCAFRLTAYASNVNI